jgi:methionyl aminopeptidase
MRPFPYSFTGKRHVPDHIKKPDYAKTGQPNQHFQQLADKAIPINDEAAIAGIRLACLIGRKALDVGHSMVRVGVTTEEIDKAVHDYIISQDAYPSPLNYYGFPRSCCTSVNEIICHGIPDLRPLEEGDIINIDISVYKDGYHGDLNETYFVGKVGASSQMLVKATYDSLMKAIEHCKPGAMYREIGNIISNVVEPQGLSVVRSYTGHGIGTTFHMAP